MEFRAFLISPSVVERDSFPSSSNPQPSSSEKEEPLPVTPGIEPPRALEPAGVLLGGRIRPWVLEDLLNVFTSLCPDQVSKLLEEGEVVRPSVSPSRESWSWVSEGRDASWCKGGFFRTPVYRAVLSSQVGGVSRFRKSKKTQTVSQKVCYSGGLDRKVCLS